jgi:hypothetical protein
MCCEGPFEVVGIAQIATLQRSPFDRPFMAALEIVERHREVPGARQCLAGVAADKAGSAGDEDGLHGASRSWSKKSEGPAGLMGTRRPACRRSSSQGPSIQSSNGIGAGAPPPSRPLGFLLQWLTAKFPTRGSREFDRDEQGFLMHRAGNLGISALRRLAPTPDEAPERCP